MPDRLAYAFLASIAGGAITAVVAILAPIGMHDAGGVALDLAAAGLVCGLLIVFGAFLQRTREPTKLRSGSLIVIVFALAAFLPTDGGLLVGFVLSLVGGVLGLTWKQKEGIHKPAAVESEEP